jgi:hypothetical protein
MQVLKSLISEWWQSPIVKIGKKQGEEETERKNRTRDETTTFRPKGSRGSE